MINKIADSVMDALGRIEDGAIIMTSGFGTAGIPDALIQGVLDSGARELTLVANNAGNADDGIGQLLQQGRIRKIICSFPRQSDSWNFNEAYEAGKVQLELVPQGNLAERIRAAGAGIGAFFSPTGANTLLTKHCEVRTIDGKDYVLQYPIHADLALVKAEKGDRWGNLTYRMAARNFGPIMATAAHHTVASVNEIVELGELNPETIVTPGIFVNRIVQVEYTATRPGGFKR